MAKTYTYIAQAVDPNHDYDITIDPLTGQITKLVIKAVVDFGEMKKVEELDLWPSLSEERKQTIQGFYDQAKAFFDNTMLG